MSRVVKFCYRFGGQIRHEPSCLLGERKPLARDSTLSAFKETTMTVVQSIGISRWHLGFGAFLFSLKRGICGVIQLTGALYYFNNASNRQHFQNYFYHTISSVFSELDHMNILILIAVCIIGFTKINYSLINIFANINILWSRPLINVIFLCLRFISAIKVVIAILRGAIKARKFSKFEARVSWSTKLISIVDTSEKINNRCIICLDELRSHAAGADKAEKTLVLSCNHMFHLGCFKQWYETSGSCPFCRTKVEL